MHLPKMLLGAVPLALVGLVTDVRIRFLLLPSSIFVALISCLGHKEWRFIIYIVPLVNIASCRGAVWLLVHRESRPISMVSLLIMPLGPRERELLEASFDLVSSVSWQ